MKQIAVFLVCMFALIISRQAEAEVMYPDMATVWPGYDKMKDKDVIGTPDIKGVSFSYTGHYLTGISIEYFYPSIAYSGGHASYQAFAPGDWFFNIDNDSDWDFVLTTASQYRAQDGWNALSDVRNNHNWLLYDLGTNGLQYNNPNSYILAGASLYPDGWTGRTGHPALANLGLYNRNNAENIYFSGWDSGWVNTPKTGQANTYSVFWDLTKFGSQGIFLGDNGGILTYGFSLTCANDVLYGTAPIPTPEPTTMLLLGTGMLALGAMARKRR